MSYFRTSWLPPSEPQENMANGWHWQLVGPLPPFVRTMRGSLIHRVRWVVVETSKYYGFCESWRMWCGQTIFRTTRGDNVVIENPTDWVCHRCDDRAHIVGGLPYSGLLPQTGCEASNGAYFRTRREPLTNA